MRFLLLGQLTVLDDRGIPLELGGLKQRAVLGALLVHPNEVVRKTELIDWLWSSSPPASASHSVDVYVSRLRRLLGNDADRLVSVAGGYRLRVGRVNARRKPFSDVHLRRVVVDSLDRAALVADEAAIPSRSLLPEGIFATHTGSSAPQSRGSGSDWHRPITLGYQRGCDTCALDATRMADQLAAMGFTVRQRPVDDVAEAASITSLDLAVMRTQSAYPDPATFLETMLGVDVPKDWLAGDVARHLDRLRTLSGPARDHEAIRLADSLDRRAPVAVYATETMGELTSGMTCPARPGAGLDLIGCAMR